MPDKLSDVKCFLLDMDGTFYLGNEIIEGSLEFINILGQQKKDYIFLTNNSSKNSISYANKISNFGLSITSDKVFTSGEATAIYLTQNFPGAGVVTIGTSFLKNDFRQLGIKLNNVNPDIIVLGFDTTITYKKLWKLCDFVRSGLPYIATHPDINCPTENGFMPDIGAIIAFVKASTNREPDIIIGKPNHYIIDAISRKENIPISDLAMVGDRLYTDIALGQSSGITTCLVLSGETNLEDVKISEYQPDYIFDDLKAIGNWLSNKKYNKH